MQILWGQREFFLGNNGQHEYLLPAQIQLAVSSGTISQVKVDQALVWDANNFRDRFEIRYGFFVQTNGNLFLELRRVWIFSRG